MLPVQLTLYLLLVNLAALMLFGYDKRLAQKHRYRVAEKYLFFSAVAGGTVGALAGMYIFRHKTKHPGFTRGLPVLLLAQIILLVYWA